MEGNIIKLVLTIISVLEGTCLFRWDVYLHNTFDGRRDSTFHAGWRQQNLKPKFGETGFIVYAS